MEETSVLVRALTICEVLAIHKRGHKTWHSVDRNEGGLTVPCVEDLAENDLGAFHRRQGQVGARSRWERWHAGGEDKRWTQCTYALAPMTGNQWRQQRE